MNTSSKTTEQVQCKCGGEPSYDKHTCPFTDEFSKPGDESYYCNCCRACERDCCADI